MDRAAHRATTELRLAARAPWILLGICVGAELLLVALDYATGSSRTLAVGSIRLFQELWNESP